MDDARHQGRTNDDAPANGEDRDRLKVDEGPVKQHGDALRDGSGSRQGQCPPVTGAPSSDA